MPTGSDTDDGYPDDPAGLLRDELAGERTRLSNKRTQMSNERTRMANERTLLAYLRSAIMLAASGATLIQLYPMRTDIKAIGVVLIVAGIGLLVFGGIRYRRLGRLLEPVLARNLPASKTRESRDPRGARAENRS